MTAALEAAIAAIDRAVPADDQDPQRQLIAAKCRGLMVGYHERWNGSGWTALALEQTVHLPIVNPETGRTSRTWTQAGKHDGVVSGYGRRCLLEHKTTSDDIADPAAPYWRRLAIDAQVSAYTLQAWQGGEHLDGTLYDVVRKPGIRPKALSRKDVAEITTTGNYCGHVVPDDVYDAVVRGQSDECLVLYTLRLAAETTADPQRYYQRRQVPRLDDDVMEYAGELWAVGQEILAARNTGRHYRNSAACLEFNRACEYLGVCSGSDTFDSDRWEKVDQVHGELDLPDGVEHRSVLTHSRIKTFQTCRRKHHYRYDVGARRRDHEEGEALYLGTVIHLALEAWWSHQGEAHATADNCSVTAIDQPAAAGDAA